MRTAHHARCSSHGDFWAEPPDSHCPRCWMPALYEVRWACALALVYVVAVLVTVMLVRVKELEGTAGHAGGLPERVPFWRAE